MIITHGIGAITGAIIHGMGIGIITQIGMIITREITKRTIKITMRALHHMMVTIISHLYLHLRTMVMMAKTTSMVTRARTGI
jgi:hypothetical protein